SAQGSRLRGTPHEVGFARLSGARLSLSAKCNSAGPPIPLHPSEPDHSRFQRSAADTKQTHQVVHTQSPPALSHSTKAGALRDKRASSVPVCERPYPCMESMVRKGSSVRVRLRASLCKAKSDRSRTCRFDQVT